MDKKQEVLLTVVATGMVTFLSTKFYYDLEWRNTIIRDITKLETQFDNHHDSLNNVGSRLGVLEASIRELELIVSKTSTNFYGIRYNPSRLVILAKLYHLTQEQIQEGIKDIQLLKSKDEIVNYLETKFNFQKEEAKLLFDFNESEEIHTLRKTFDNKNPK